MNQERDYPPEIFDRAAARYDSLVGRTDDFPHAGYKDLLLGVVRQAAPAADMRILELGPGTGNLTFMLEEIGCEIWAVDFSCQMIDQAAGKLRHTHLIEGDLRQDWWSKVQGPFDRIVSTYALHHFDLPAKCRMLQRMTEELLAVGGWITIGDVSFPTRSQLDAARRRVGEEWEEEEYWVADEVVAALAPCGLKAEYRQVSWCGGTYTIRQAAE